MLPKIYFKSCKKVDASLLDWENFFKCQNIQFKTDRNFRSSIGFAMNWETPIGPLQFNWSRPQKYLEAASLEYFSLNLATRF